MKKLAILFSTLFILGGCASMDDSGSTGGSAGGNAEVEAIIAKAEAAIKKSASMGGEWRDAKKKILKDAKAALAKGDLKTAEKKAKLALFQGEMGVKQAEEQKNAGPWLF